MREILTGGQMKACDKETIEQFGVSSPVLMERAALACVDALMQHFACCEEDGQPVLILCGNGNNGGDGVAIARILYERGVNVVFCMTGLPDLQPETAKEKLSADCLAQYRSARAYGILQITYTQAICGLQAHDFPVVVDAMFGVGLSRPLREHDAKMVVAVNESGAKVLAVDMPTGIHADTGAVMGCAVQADMTVTFAFAKRGQILFPGRSYCGECITADIGITKYALARSLRTHAAFAYDKSDLKRLPARSDSSNKGTYGKVLAIAGSREICGAAYLCGAAAYRTGAGLVQIISEEANRVALQTMLPEALLKFYKEEDIKETEGTVSKLLADKLRWASVTAIGPGLSQSAAADALLCGTLENCRTPLVIDADGLNLLARNISLLSACQCPVIITPHMMEMSRLTGVSVAELKTDPVRYASAFAKAHQVICVLKDACTVVCDEDGQVFLNTSGNNGMSTGGAGDVLTGVICGLLAQHMEPFAAACLGVYLHGCAGDLAAETSGTYGLTARCLLEGLQKLLKG